MSTLTPGRGIPSEADTTVPLADCDCAKAAEPTMPCPTEKSKASSHTNMVRLPLILILLFVNIRHVIDLRSTVKNCPPVVNNSYT